MSLLSHPPTFAVERSTGTVDTYGSTATWADAGTLVGWLDMLTGTDQPTSALDAAFIEESTHIFITDGFPALVPTDADRLRGPDGRVYYVTYVDDVTGVGDHLEIYLRFAGKEV